METLNEYQKEWVALLRTNPPKTTRELVAWEDGQPVAECCLGVACRALGLEPTAWGDHGVFYGKYWVDLPPDVAQSLGISVAGDLNEAGRRVAFIFMRESFIECSIKWEDTLSCLANINDFSTITHEYMADLVEMLFKYKGFDN